jgi:lysophospholipase L1-like esterase
MDNVIHSIVMRQILRTLIASLWLMLPLALAAAPGRPTLFIIGDSTVNNTGHGLMGWGTPIAYFFDTNQITVENDAIGGRSSRSFLQEGRWDKVMAKLKPGDFVLMQMGHNDGGPLTDARGRGSLRGIGDASVVVTNASGKLETVHTYGWYMRKYVTDTQSRGATPIMVTLIPRNDWVDGRIPRSDNSYAGWARQVAAATHIQVVDLNDLAARHYEQLGADQLRADIFINEHTHTSVAGARLNAACVVEGLRALPDCALAAYLLPAAQVRLPPLPKPYFKPVFWPWAPTPPMGWNSWDSFATTINEAQVKAEADVMAAQLKSHGWQYLVVDIQWFEPGADGFAYRQNPLLAMDEYGRLLPATNRFPSAVDGNGFLSLADYVHRQGLKFGIHLMRGIPRQAVRANCPIKGSRAHAGDIADPADVCGWNQDNFGVDMKKPGAQEYYNSVFALIASWGVDFVKVDDLSRPYHAAEIEAIRKAIDRTGRPIVLSTSPGPTPLADGYDISAHANLWRVSDDFWDQWSAPGQSMHGLKEQFAPLAAWASFTGPGHFADADMLPLGTLDLGKRQTRFSPDEQRTLVTLWSIARSPLIMGGDLTKLDDFTRSLLTNDDVIAVDQTGRNAHQVFNRDGLIAWTSASPGTPDKFVALFNTTDRPSTVSVRTAELGLPDGVRVRDLWAQQSAGDFDGQFSRELPPHGAALYRFSPR